MPITVADAADEIAALFVAAWIEGAGYAAEFPNVAFDRPGKGATWARFIPVFETGGQSTLAGPLDGPRFARGGYLMVDVFTPLGVGLKSGYDAAEIVLRAYEGKRTPSDIWFRNVRIADEGQGRGQENAWWQTTVMATFTFDN